MFNPFHRTEMIIGKYNLKKLKESKVAVFGIGGVGSYVVEGLVRCGVGTLILIDFDTVDITNINRQLHASMNTVGKVKVEVMKKRILDINPEANVIAYNKLYNSETANDLLSSEYDYVVDAIDMVSSKLDLIEKCKKMDTPIISSMGTGNKLNPTMFKVADIYETKVCPLAKVMRKELRRRGIKELKVVYSEEKPIKPQKQDEQEDRRNQTPGSISFVPSVAGLIIASEVIKDLIKQKN
ncbi:tRNA threonylcarbamoyladenosine dehydratase [Caldisalinibacter kiritimatiensis]|uniref:HesA/MoeB/ThiF family protein n=1 Tax=Caldisalinibacter kiritimatiensis TaxID=1304284 RepID=R1CPQ2_9FIRM|nr:tRNA threonylcarbamoyladenosine dehydratase [Caldisalinibacter kiritimatiensis]EOD00651.1 HesA/MoeB/ThiF family protein [Caldisalinibacter kiritimatiensis]